MWSYEGELGRMLEDFEASVLDKAAQKDREGGAYDLLPGLPSARHGVLPVVPAAQRYV